MRNPVLLAVLFTALATPSFAQKTTPQAVPVTTVNAQEKPVTKAKDFVGRIEATDRVEVRARVTGYLEAVLFKEGELVKEGQPLYRIEPDTFKAAVEQAEGALAGTKASKILSNVELERAKELLQKSFGTPQKRDQAEAADENAAANIIRRRQTWTRPRSTLPTPTSGRPSPERSAGPRSRRETSFLPTAAS